MNSDANDLDYQAGFPHSDIPGSKLVCQLPEAFRRLPRPSSPVAAKASTICALSLDHITPNDFSQRARTSALDGVIYRSRMQHTLERDTKKSMPRSASLRLSGFLMNLYRTSATFLRPSAQHHGCWRWWSQPESNRRPPACKAGALPAELWPLSLVDNAKARRYCTSLLPIWQCLPGIFLIPHHRQSVFGGSG